jgi:hypothetical protein
MRNMQKFEPVKTTEPITQRKQSSPSGSMGATGKSTTSAAKGGGAKGIPPSMQSRLESSSGVSFSDVNVHYNSSKPSGVGALAYTQGNNVFVGPGQEKHLSHELGHVVQQKQGRVKSTGSVGGMPLNADPKLEKEADNFKF